MGKCLLEIILDVDVIMNLSIHIVMVKVNLVIRIQVIIIMLPKIKELRKKSRGRLKS